MQTPAVHHLVTIRLEDHVEQLEETHRALIAVRANLDDIQHSLEYMSRQNMIESSVPEELRMAFLRLRTTSHMVDAVLKTIEPPDCGPSEGIAGLN
jgi:hypothetical protein